MIPIHKAATKDNRSTEKEKFAYSSVVCRIQSINRRNFTDDELKSSEFFSDTKKCSALFLIHC